MSQSWGLSTIFQMFLFPWWKLATQLVWPQSVFQLCCCCSEYQTVPDTCLLENGGCEHFCHENSAGRRGNCSCADGYDLDADGFSCKAKGGRVISSILTLYMLSSKTNICIQTWNSFSGLLCCGIPVENQIVRQWCQLTSQTLLWY